MSVVDQCHGRCQQDSTAQEEKNCSQDIKQAGCKECAVNVVTYFHFPGMIFVLVSLMLESYGSAHAEHRSGGLHSTDCVCDTNLLTPPAMPWFSSICLT